MRAFDRAARPRGDETNEARMGRLKALCEAADSAAGLAALCAAA
jgi:hypothetical protein